MKEKRRRRYSRRFRGRQRHKQRKKVERVGVRWTLDRNMKEG